MNTALIIHDGDWLGEAAWLALDDFARACGVEVGYVTLLVDEGLLTPPRAEPQWRFGGEELARVRRIRRLQRDFEASLPSVAVMLDLLDELERLRSALQRAGLEP
ncbi:MAG: MerR family transcriptional regulator [Burkholderiales bacterium]|nr:MerR family transcriptional regulator [Burkholderiales bacterium]